MLACGSVDRFGSGATQRMPWRYDCANGAGSVARCSSTGAEPNHPRRDHPIERMLTMVRNSLAMQNLSCYTSLFCPAGGDATQLRHSIETLNEAPRASMTGGTGLWLSETRRPASENPFLGKRCMFPPREVGVGLHEVPHRIRDFDNSKLLEVTQCR